MKFKEKYESWKGKYWTGKKNNIIFTIEEYTRGFEREKIGFYVTTHNLCTDKNYNSLWDNLYFETLEKAQEWCENYREEVKD